jgi:hypothetical protein
MFPEDRVLVGVINRRRDLALVRDQHWYRIPQKQMLRGVNVEYVAFFLSRAFKERNGAVHYYAERRGLELDYRRNLLPDEPDHPRAREVYYKVELGDLCEKVPAVLNPSRRRFAFIYTTWDRFVNAREIGDLYSKADYFVDRIYHALRNRGIQPDRFWDAERRATGHGAQLRILCENGEVVAGTDPNAGSLYLDDSQRQDAILRTILGEIAKQGGPVTINIPVEGFL